MLVLQLQLILVSSQDKISKKILYYVAAQHDGLSKDIDLHAHILQY